MKAMLFASAAALLAVAPAPAQTPVAVPAFDSVELRGGGEVILRHGPTQRVTLRRGSREFTRFSVDREGQLTIDACIRQCRDYDLEVEIVTPAIEGVAIRGGGEIRTAGSFPDRGMLGVAISGGGAIDVSAIESGSVAAAIRGGGEIRAHARNSLMAAIHGGGSIRYRGNPHVTSAVRGGGSVARIGN